MVRQRRRSLWSNTKLFLPALLGLLVPAAACGGLFAEAAAEPSELRGTVPVEDACPYQNVTACERADAIPLLPAEEAAAFLGSEDLAAFVPLMRKLDLPSVEPGGACPVSPRIEEIEHAAATSEFGPVYLSLPENLNAALYNTVWLADGLYEGPILVRGARLDANNSGIQFLYEDAETGWARDLLPLVDIWATDISPSKGEGWRQWSAGISTMARGCYALQIDGSDFSQLVVFEVVRCDPPDCDRNIEAEIQEQAEDGDKPRFNGDIGEFKVASAYSDSNFGCPQDVEWMDAVGQGEMRASELYFTLPQGGQADRTTWAGYRCGDEPWLIGGYGSLPGSALAGADVTNRHFRGQPTAFVDAPRERFVETEVGGRPALLVVPAGHLFPSCELLVVERRPSETALGIGWSARIERNCDEAVPLFAAFLEQWAEPWVEPAATAADALQDYMDNRQDTPEYVGLCHRYRGEPSPDDICGFDHGQSGDQKVFGISTLDNQGWAIELYFVRPEGEGWLVDHAEPGPCRNSIPCPAPPGATIEIVVDDEGSCANVRAEPAIDAPVNVCLPGDTQGLTEGEGVWVDGRIWVKLVERGWVSASYLRCTGNCQYPDDYFSCGV